jgi:uncharacterized protein (UPF0218 family)
MFDVSKLLMNETQRESLKKPLGELISGAVAECNQALKGVQDIESPRRLILVGDTISRNAIHSGIRPNVIIIDQREMRREAVEFNHGKARVFRTLNEPATINLLAWQAVSEAVEKGDSVVVVDGEEDLLTLVAILTAPIGSVVAYGQPSAGIVLVRVTPDKKNEIQTLIDQMEKTG